MELDALSTIAPDRFRAALPAFLASHIADEEAAASSVARVAALVAAWDDETVASVVRGLVSLGAEARPYPANPAARELARLWCRDVITEAEVRGAEGLRAVADRGPTIVVSNHSSYVDSTAIDAVMARGGAAGEADRLMSVAGPKVYSDLFRRFASLCLHTLPVPQSTQLEHTARVSPRELARRAGESLRQAGEQMEEGRILLLYPEGSRTRSGRLEPFVRGAARYLRTPGSWVVPAALTGTDAMMPVGQARLTPGPVRWRMGEPLEVAAFPGPRDALAAAHAAVAELLPAGRRPTPGTAPLR